MHRVLLCILVVVALLLIAVDCGGGTAEKMQGVIIDRHYKPSEHWTTSDSKGTVTSHHSSEEYLVIVKTNGRIVKVETDETLYYGAEKGQTLKYHANIGLMTGWTWGYYSSEKENEGHGW